MRSAGRFSSTTLGVHYSLCNRIIIAHSPEIRGDPVKLYLSGKSTVNTVAVKEQQLIIVEE
jgi:hypothetical protein